MGTGKSTVGKKLAELLNKEFVEMDLLIEQKVGKPIPEIFSQDGETRFREYELDISKELSKRSNCIISTGGGVVLNKLNLDYLSQSSEIVVLIATPKEIIKRIMKDGPEKRPVIAKPNPLSEIKKVLDYRLPLYKNASEIIINTTGKTVDSIVREIIDILEGKRNIDPFFIKEAVSDKCIICKCDVEECQDGTSDVCVICKKESATGQRCEDNHFVCTNCLSSPSIDLMIETCLGLSTTNPIEIMNVLLPFASQNRATTDHNTVVAGSLLMSVYNQLKNQKVKNPFGSLSPERIVVAMKKAAFLPTHSGAFYGISGPSAAVGLSVATFLETVPKQTIARNEPLLGSVHAILGNIEGENENGKLGSPAIIENQIRTVNEYKVKMSWPSESAPGCIKREVFNALISGAEYFKQMYDIELPLSAIKCTYSDSVPQCAKERCVYFN